MTININLTGMDLAAAGKEGITALVNACAGLAGASLGAEIELPEVPHTAETGDGIVVPEKVYADEPIPAKAEPKNMRISIVSADGCISRTITPDEPLPKPPAAPVTPATPAPIPTAGAPTYTVEELQLACAPLTDANRMGELQAVCAKYGAASLLDIPKEQYGALAADLRALGARL